MIKSLSRRMAEGLRSFGRQIVKGWVWFSGLSFWPKLAAVVAVVVAVTGAVVGIVVAGSTLQVNESTVRKNDADTKKAEAEASQMASASASASLAALPSEKARTVDGSSPDDLCKRDFLELKTFRFVPPGAEQPATTMRVLSSERCTSAWVHVLNTLEGTRVKKTIERLDAPDLPGHMESTPDDVSIGLTNDLNKNSFTLQVYAPQCVWVSLELTRADSGELLWEVPRQQVCRPS